MLLFGNLPIALQGGAVNNFFIGRHLLPHRELRERENLVLGGNVLDPVVVLDEFAAVVQYIAAGGKVAVLVDPHVPPICFIIEVREQVIGNVNGLHIST